MLSWSFVCPSRFCFLTFPFLLPHGPLVAFGTGDGSWSMSTKHKATIALRQVMSLAGLQPVEYALHFIRIGGTTHLSASGASPEVLRGEGRWAGGHGYRPYVRSHGRNAAWVSDEMTSECGMAKRPGQGTGWGEVAPSPDDERLGIQKR